jgi:Fe-S oxidoreductase
MARFKSEFLADYWRRHGTPLSARALGHIHELSRWMSIVAPLANAVARSAPARWLNEQLLGLDRRRLPPPWTSDTFARRFARRRRSASTSTAPAVLLFNDTFTNYFDPEIGEAGADVLESAGCAVGLAPNGCCGRPLISQGLLAAARQRAEFNTDRLFPLASGGARFVFFEPSCLSALKDDGPALLRGAAQARAQRVGDACVLFEEFMEEQWQDGKLSLTLKPGPERIALHGHCHQKSMGLLAPARALLSRVPGATVIDLDAGCCGMAGSFGYAREHYEISRQIGERRLLPAARALDDRSVLVAAGTSCRHQVEDFAATRALHPAVLLRSLLTGAA